MTCHGIPDLSLESIVASGRNAEKISLPTLQSKMKCDPEGYESELFLLYRHFDSSLDLFQQQASLNMHSDGTGSNGGDPTVAKELGDLAMFLSHVTPFYPNHLSDFPKKLSDLLHSAARSLPSNLKCHLAQALILLMNRKMVDIGDNLALFMELQTLGDRTLRKLAFSHVIQSIRRMNQKHKNEAKNRALQNILFSMLQEEDESKAKRSLVILCDLHRRRVWFDDRTANAICTACFHSSSRIMISALSFLLGYERLEEADDSDDSSGEEDMTPQKAQVVISREAVYKAHHKGTSASKKKKQAKLQRAIRTMKKQQRTLSEKNTSNYYSPLSHLKDAQGFAEKLFSRLQTSNERFEVKMMILKVVARTVGLHRLILLNFYPFMQKYVQPHQRDITELLAAAVQACHDMVPPDAVEPLFRQVVNQFVHDRSRTEAIAVGLNVVREICLRIPLLMTEDLLQDLVQYKKSHEKAVSTAARSLIVLFREVCPSLLIKKDRGRPTDPKAKPKAFGEMNVSTTVPGVELLDDDDEKSDTNESESSVSDYDEAFATNDEKSCELNEDGEASENDELEEESDDFSDFHDDEEQESDAVSNETEEESDEDEEKVDKGDSVTKKRKFCDVGQLSAADTSLRALKRLAGETMQPISSDSMDGILSNEDFQRIRELQAKKEAKVALAQHGLLRNGSDAKAGAYKIPNAEQLSTRRMNPAKLEVKRKMTKEEKLELIKAGREDRVKYQAKTAIKKKKTGGSSNRQKEHKKAMPMAAKRSKVARSRQEKKRQQKLAGKQFRGKKAWK
ncbi:Sda1-like protein [Thalictrum thalictroides]|uniref:Protein SDA1 n=1 Tax=Thalictrum thalictroides TaxID=46969 RepID=A0A7J6URI4_THATH|nr:Sda1-like protein [Thalictrum thalictroides]